MDVAAYLKELLYREQFVYVPGLGTFLMRKTAGIYNQEQQRFYPPKNSIDFVKEEKQDDELEKYISQQKNLSPQAAKYFIEKFVDQLKTDSAFKNIPIKEALFPAEAETVNTSFNQENFGLPPVSLSAIKKEPAFAANQEKEEEVPQKDYVENFYREFSKTLPEEKEETNSKKSTGFWASVLLLLVICVLGCYALYVYYPDIYSRFIPHKQAAPIVVKTPVADTLNRNSIIQKEIPKDTVATKTVADTPKSAAKISAPARLPAATDTVTATLTVDPDLVAKSPYEIIGASFKTLKGAKAFLAQLKSKGMHRAKILNNTPGRQMLITFGSFQDKETAQAALEKLRVKDTHSEAYIQHYLK